MYLSLTLPIKIYEISQSNDKFAVQIKFKFFYI